MCNMMESKTEERPKAIIYHKLLEAAGVIEGEIEDKELARIIGVSRSVISKARNGGRNFGKQLRHTFMSFSSSISQNDFKELKEVQGVGASAKQIAAKAAIPIVAEYARELRETYGL